MSIINNLFPPLVETYQASFIGDKNNATSAEECVIKFKLAPYTSWSEIKSVWFTVVDPQTNRTKLNSEQWPAEVGTIAAANIDFNTNTQTGSFSIQRNWISPNYWEAGKTYKIQLRFCSLAAAKDENPTTVGSKVNPDSVLSITANSAYFSEWSTITLVTPVQSYNITLNSFLSIENDFHMISPYENIFSANIDYGDTGEYIDSFRLAIYDDNNILLHSSDLIAPEELNTIRYAIPIGLSASKTYRFQLTSISNNLYKRVENYNVKVKTNNNTALGFAVTAEEDPDYGRIKIIINTVGHGSFTKRLLIKRTSNESNFTLWEDLLIQKVQLTSNNSQAIVYDNTADSGVIYQYAIIEIDAFGKYTSSDIKTNKVLMLLDDIFINGGGRQLKIKFDPTINSYQHTVMDSAIQTIGGKYPIIKRNGQANYRQIGISGLITFHMDHAFGYKDIQSSLAHSTALKWGDPNESLFISKDELLLNAMETDASNKQINLYEQFNKKHGISMHEDFILERKFREEVTKFLLDGQVKLFRSPTESPALIRLMNVTVTPNAQLGRMIYSFSAVGHEIADCTPENMILYNIQGPQVASEILAEEKILTNQTAQYNITAAYDEQENALDGKINLLTKLNGTNKQHSVLSASDIQIIELNQNQVFYTGYAIDKNKLCIVHDPATYEGEIVTNSILVYSQLKGEESIKRSYYPVLQTGQPTISLASGEYTYLALALPQKGVGIPTTEKPVSITIKAANVAIAKYQ